MARCSYCGTETLRHVNDLPICVPCVDLSPEGRCIRASLFRELSEAVKRADAANDAFKQVTTAVSSGLPHSDVIQRIKNVSPPLTVARTELLPPHPPLTHFLQP